MRPDSVPRAYTHVEVRWPASGARRVYSFRDYLLLESPALEGSIPRFVDRGEAIRIVNHLRKGAS